MRGKVDHRVRASERACVCVCVCVCVQIQRGQADQRADYRAADRRHLRGQGAPPRPEDDSDFAHLRGQGGVRDLLPRSRGAARSRRSTGPRARPGLLRPSLKHTHAHIHTHTHTRGLGRSPAAEARDLPADERGRGSGRENTGDARGGRGLNVLDSCPPPVPYSSPTKPLSLSRSPCSSPS